MNVNDIEPRECFTWFAAIAAIPHCSYNERALGDYLVAFASERGLDCERDASGNVLIRKPAAAGMEHAPMVVLQGHMDMVCVKQDGVAHDFAGDPIRLVVDGDRLRADGTTLGADNGIGLAFILALLDAHDIPHPPLEAVITVAEEVGMEGAAGFDASKLKGCYFINTDSEEEGVFCVSCAGGRRSVVSLPVAWEPADSGPGVFFNISLAGLAGGHSGLEIIKERGNAVKLMGRALARLSDAHALALCGIAGGSADNVIPFECRATVRIDAGAAALRRKLVALRDEFSAELQASDGAGLTLTAAPVDARDRVLNKDSFDRVLAALLLFPHGILAMDLNVLPLRQVETSSNLGIVATEEDAVILTGLSRSSLNSRKLAVYEQIATLAKMLDGTVRYSGDYPAWEYKPGSKLGAVFHDTFTELFGREPTMEGIHAGLECGLFFDKFRTLGRDVDFIALGPDITGAHTPVEAVSIPSVANTWKLLKAALARIRE